jgi:sphinganine C4-monooxygenase
MVWFDLWHYAWHRTLHVGRFLYQNLHSWHHRLVVPYSFGALYGHPVESFITDTIGGMPFFLVSGMSPRASIFFFSLCTVKAIDNHCGLSMLPFWDCMSFWNSAAYHDVHRQLHGGKYNYSQLFFMVWDRMFGTYMPFLIEGRGGGMLQVQAPSLDYRRINK